ncbi:uncharacterized protein KY384_003021 [Bacidia gigantensis]|uniref:uncharacterized protein n=1 Tax=Bacidia gigantensis TaxID=2732470 RepID=UPI001D053923|nr:uncharacterized protein KY384_003021 [Bacidia gigantensis]KAG8531392.1 hypothetical protein KY384_003021 [Bacidia gigantensis]
MIENQLEDVVYQSKIQHWLESRDCAQEIFEESGLFTTNRPKTGNLRHYNMAQSYLRKVSLATSSKATTKLMRCINIFAHDSALYARFVVLRPPDYENQTYYSTSDPADVSASYVSIREALNLHNTIPPENPLDSEDKQIQWTLKKFFPSIKSEHSSTSSHQVVHSNYIIYSSQILVDQTKQAASDAYESAKKVTEQGAFALTDDLRPGGEPGGKGLAGDPGPGSGP